VSYDPATQTIENLGDTLKLGNSRLGGVSFILNNTPYFGLGYYSEGGSIFGNSVYDNHFYKINKSTTPVPPVVPAKIDSAYFSFDAEPFVNEYNYDVKASSFGSCTISEDAISGKSSMFSSTDAGIDLFNFQPKSFTINIWFKTLDSTKIQRILHKGDRGGSAAHLWSYSLVLVNGKIRYSVGGNDGIGAFSIFSKDSINSNKWYKITCTFNDNTKYGKLYLNDVLQDSLLSSNSIIETPEVLKISYYPNISDDKQTINGYVDELKLFNNELSLSEIKKLSNIPTIVKKDSAYFSFNAEPFVNEYNHDVKASSFGSCTISEDAISGKSSMFSSTDAGIDLFNFQPKSFTINIWFKTLDSTKIQRILHKGDRGGSAAHLWSYSLVLVNGKIRYSLGGNDGIGAFSIFSKDSINSNKWYKITCTFNDDTKYGKLYLNNVLQDSMLSSNSIIETPEVLKISYYPNMSDDKQAINGYVDELRLFEQELSVSEISKLEDFFEFPTAIKEPVNNNILVYPNPVSSILKISNNSSEKIKYFEIFNLYGVKILRSDKIENIDISSLKSGFYQLKITTTTRQYGYQILKK